MQISKQTFVITGAGSGLGLATAKYLSAQGTHIIDNAYLIGETIRLDATLRMGPK